jgi:hypothetical protein
MSTTESAQFDGNARESSVLQDRIPARAESAPHDPGATGDRCAPSRRPAPITRRLKEAAKSTLPDAAFLSLLHHKCIGRFPNLRHPATFNENILQRNLHPDPRYAGLTDKLSVREYVAGKIGSRHLIPLVAVPDIFTREVFDALPSAFVMKANHGSSFVEIVRNKAETSFETLQRLATQWLATDFYKVARERHYREIVPRLFFEQLLLDRHGEIPADYKVHCFGGRPGRPVTYTLVISDRFGTNTHGDVYDADWNHLDIAIGHYKRSASPAPRPDNFDSVLAVASTLCEDFGYVRVDLYAPDDEVYFGELTFTPGAGVLPFTPDHIDYEWGRLLGGSCGR